MCEHGIALLENIHWFSQQLSNSEGHGKSKASTVFISVKRGNTWNTLIVILFSQRIKRVFCLEDISAKLKQSSALVMGKGSQSCFKQVCRHTLSQQTPRAKGKCKN